MRRTASEILHLRKLPKLEPWWRERGRLGRLCPGCDKFYVRGRPEWETCLDCELKIARGDWTPNAERDFIEHARAVFPGSCEDALAGEPEPVNLRFSFDDEVA